MKLFILLIFVAMASFASPYSLKSIPVIKSDTTICCNTMKEANVQTSKINVWMKTGISFSDRNRWEASAKKLLILPHYGTFYVLHDTAWNVNK